MHNGMKRMKEESMEHVKNVIAEGQWFFDHDEQLVIEEHPAYPQLSEAGVAELSDAVIRSIRDAMGHSIPANPTEVVGLYVYTDDDCLGRGFLVEVVLPRDAVVIH